MRHFKIASWVKFTVSLAVLAVAWAGHAALHAADPPGMVQPKEFQATLIAHVTYERRETQVSEGDGTSDRRSSTISTTGTSNVQVMCRTDEWGKLSLQPLEGSKAICQAQGSVSESSDIETPDASDKETYNGTGELSADASLPIGICNIDNNEGLAKEMKISLLLGVTAKGKDHLHMHFKQQTDAPPDIDRENEVERGCGPFGGAIFPMSQRPRDYQATEGGPWYGDTTQILANNGYRVTFGGSREFTVEKGHRISEIMHVSVDLIAGKPVDADLDIAPVDAAAYDKFIPLPVSDDPAVVKLFGQNAATGFVATLKAKDPKAANPMGIIDFYLENVSQHKGICGNYPANGTEHPGLEFVAMPGIQVDSGDPTHAVTTGYVGAATVMVKANETGAYGRLRAVCGAMASESVYKRTGKHFIEIPRDDNHNHIADAWEKQDEIGVYSKNYPATWDEEGTPKGYNKGDGLTLYEEYRGFVFAGADKKPMFGRLSPNVKKLFLYPKGPDVDLYNAGIAAWSAASKVQALLIAEQDELMSDNSDPRDASWVNFNSSINDGADFAGKQHAVVVHALAPGEVGLGEWANTKPLARGNENAVNPNEIYHVGVSREGIEAALRSQYVMDTNLPATSHDFQWLANHGSSPAQIAAILQDAAQMKARVDKGVKYTVLHELGHAIGMQHHGLKQMGDEQKANGGNLPEGKKETDYYSTGPTNCPMYYWFNGNDDFVLTFALGKWDPVAGAWQAGKTPQEFGSLVPWVYCDEDAGKLRLH